MYTDGKMLKFFILQRASINTDAKEFTHFFQFLFALFILTKFHFPPFLFFPTILFHGSQKLFLHHYFIFILTIFIPSSEKPLRE